MSEVTVEKLCPFCQQESRTWSIADTANFFGFDCNNCKQYFISLSVIQKLAGKMSNSHLNCIAENIKSNSRSGEVLTSWHLENEKLPVLASNITVKRFEPISELPIIHSEKIDGLLLLLGSKASGGFPFDTVRLTLQDVYSLKIADFRECFQWLLELEDSGYIESTYLKSRRNTIGHSISNKDLLLFEAALTPKGWKAVFDRQQTINSKKVFIAMQFKWEDKHTETKFKYIEAVKRGCAICGFEAEVVSQDHAEQITDRIVAEIKSSRFVIADFTYNNQGAYYEAGLARGLGKKVIHTVMSGHTDDLKNASRRLHFDIRQINYLEWSDTSDLSDRIAFRIKAVIEES